MRRTIAAFFAALLAVGTAALAQQAGAVRGTDPLPKIAERGRATSSSSSRTTTDSTRWASWGIPS